MANKNEKKKEKKMKKELDKNGMGSKNDEDKDVVEDKKTNKEDGNTTKKKGKPRDILTPKDTTNEQAMAALLPAESKVMDDLTKEDLDEVKKEKTPQEEDINPIPLKWHPDEIHCSQLCNKCLKINLHWPPPPRFPPTQDKDPNLIYPGDVDTHFKPARGDILIVHPRGFGLDPKPTAEDLWWKSKRIGGGYCVCFDGEKKFKFEVGDLVVRMGSYGGGDIGMDMELEGMDLEKPDVENKSIGKNQKNNPKTPKPKKIIDPRELDPMICKPYEKVEMYICSGFEVVKEDEFLNTNELEVELKRIFETNTKYTLAMDHEKVGNPLGNNNLKRKSQNDFNLVICNDKVKEKSILKANNPKGNIDSETISVVQEKNTNKELEIKTPHAYANTKMLEEIVEGGRANSLRTIAFETSQASKRKLESQENDANKNLSTLKEEKPPKINLIWTFLGSQAQLHMNPQIVPLEEPKCPGLGCFYQQYLNLGSSCKMEHNPVPNLGELLIPEGAWLKNFNHRKNKWRSMIQWYVPSMPPLGSTKGETSIDGGVVVDEMNPEQDTKEKRKSTIKSKEIGETDKKIDKDEDLLGKEGQRKQGGAKGKFNFKGKILKGIDVQLDKEGNPLEKISKEKGKVMKGDQINQIKIKDSVNIGSPIDKGTNKEKIYHEEQPLHKEVQVPQDLQEKVEEQKEEILDFPSMPNHLKKKLVPGMILLRPLVGRQLKDEPPPIDKWKWPRKKKIWGSVEMFMVEWGGEGLRWVFWGNSERICDTAYPLPPPEAKLKFLHPADAKIDVHMIEEEKVR